MAKWSKLFGVAEKVLDATQMQWGSSDPGARTRGFEVRCQARITGIADIQPLGGQDEPIQQAAYIGLEVARPDGTVRTCVRQDIPPEFQARVVPGQTVNVKAHPQRRGEAFILWGNAPGGGTIVDDRVVAWPDADRWPTDGAIEFYPRSKRSTDVVELRASRLSTLASLVAAQGTMRATGNRPIVSLTVDHASTAGMQRVELQVPLPDLAACRLRPGCPVALLVDATGAKVDVDWEATVAHPQNWYLGPV